MSAAETTVVILGVVDVVIALGLLVRFAMGTREFATGFGRVVARLRWAGGVLTMSMFGMTVMALDS